MSENRLLGADFVRAVACIMVLVHHISQRISPEVLSPGQQGATLFAMMGAFGVGAFFVLSGFLLSRPFWLAYDAGKPMPSLRTYALRRAARILPGFWLALTVSFILSFAMLGVTLDGALWLRYVAGVFLVADWHWLTFFPVEFNGPLWSISFEVTSYLLLPLGLAAAFLVGPQAGRSWGARALWVAVIAGLVGLQWVIITSVKLDDVGRGWQHGMVGGAKFWMPRFNPVAFFAIFALGALAAGLQVRWAKYRSWIFDGLAIAGAGMAVWAIATLVPGTEGYGVAEIPYGFPPFPLGVGLMLASLPSSAILGRLVDNPVSAYVARVSFGVYVWHYMLMEIIRVLWLPDYVYGGMHNVWLWAGVSAGVVAVAFAIATVSYTYFEAPIIRWARGYERRTPGTATLSPAAG